MDEFKQKYGPMTLIMGWVCPAMSNSNFFKMCNRFKVETPSVVHKARNSKNQSRLKIIGGPRQNQNLGPLQKDLIHNFAPLTFYSLGNWTIFWFETLITKKFLLRDFYSHLIIIFRIWGPLKIGGPRQMSTLPMG
jgi:hypothetical protein